MKALSAFAAFALILSCTRAFGGVEQSRIDSATEEFNPRPFEVALETGYLFGAINPPTDYQIGAAFLTGRVRWGVVRSDSWLRGYHQFYVSAIAEPIFKGIENHYFGFNLGMRYNFVQPGCRFVPYISGGVGAGWIDSHPEIPGGQGQDFTFNILLIRGILFEELGSFQGLNFEPQKYLNTFLSRGNNFFLQRAEAETNPAYKQIIPYALIAFENTVVYYVRGKKAGEQRLVAKGS